MTMTNDSDPILQSLALLELVARTGSAQPFAEYGSLTGFGCEHEIAELYLCRTILKICDATGFELQRYIDHERAQVLHDEPGGMA
jgi:hypothetical protein